MLQYSKTILSKVSFSNVLFRKELYKAIRNVNKEDLSKLRNWCFIMFGTTYGAIISEAFNNL